MDLSTLGIAKLEAYGFDRDFFKLFHSYLKQRKQAVKVKGCVGILKEITSGVPQGSYLRPNSVQYIYQRFILLYGWGKPP